MLKNFYRALLATVLCFVCVFSYSEAASSNRYWNDNANYPFVGGHAGYFQYLDLSSCTFVSRNNGGYEIAACWVGYHKLYREQTNGVIKFRQRQGAARPEFYDEKKKQWVVMPRIPQGAEAQREGLTYADFRSKYHTWEFNMFTLTYEQLFGKRFGA